MESIGTLFTKIDVLLMSLALMHSVFVPCMAFFSAFAIAVLAGRPFIQWLFARKIGQMIQSFDGFLLATLHKDKKNTPTMGGALIVVATLISCLIWADWSCSSVPILMGSMLLFSAIGVFDDWGKLQSKSSKGLSAKIRLFFQTLIAIAVIIYFFRTTTASNTLFVPFCSPFFVVGGITLAAHQWFTIVGCANAVNLTDGQDGLAAGLCSIICVPLIVFALTFAGQDQIAICLASLCGASLGFLWFNSHPGSVFMGDTGSLALGGTLGVASVLMGAEWFLALVGLLFVVETLSVIIQVISFKTTKRRVFRCSPLPHHFEYAGFPEEKVVIRFWIVGIILAIIGICSLL